MRIHRLTLTNFKAFEGREFTFDPSFNLLVGDNGTGKTSVLDGLAVALSVWLVEPPEASLINSRRNIRPGEIRLEPVGRGDRIQFRQHRPVRVEAVGDLGGVREVRWVRQIRKTGTRTTNADARQALRIIQRLYQQDEEGKATSLPVLANYGAGRTWLPSNERRRLPPGTHPSSRWEAFYDCFSERIRASDLQEWFRRETTAAGARGGRMRPGFEAVRRAVLRCLPGASAAWYDPDRADVIATIDGVPTPFSNFSAGQRTLLSVVADIAIRAVTQNAHLLPDDELEGDVDTLPAVLAETPGVVLIDELDVHLHPKWQRRIQDDLTRTFPRIQFVCASHSPFLIQALRPGQLLPLQELPAPVEYSGEPLEDIVEEVQGVVMPQRSRRAEELSGASERYFSLLQQGGVSQEELREAEAAYREASEPFTEHPGLNAVLRLEAMALGKERAR